MATQNAVGNGLAGSTGTGSFVGSNSPSLVTPALGTPSALVVTNATGDKLGTTTNDSAAALHVGEFISSVIASGSAIVLANNTPANVTSISLTAGDWDVWGNVYFVPGGTQVNAIGWVSSTSATLPDASLYNVVALAFTNPLGFCVPELRFSLSGTTTIYLSVQSGFTVSETAAGGIYARRVR